MPDWKEMYLELFRETEKAINILVAAQQRCEDMYINAPEPEIILLPVQDENEQKESRT